ncbi:glycosyltransferase family 9 protein [Shewanella surugensis]|uniref:Glycosyltransferase family 9 protein n=1 Tax=Shewanella surugensis TaxID=212020 RepID=A0ABT0L9M8_9GAMM|nr:glycosyltransferase family 9 protein [Shewanella surugensis]MCL1124414.1 glycosyltransferase family 9 protein [Shewanella surugensis]
MSLNLDKAESLCLLRLSAIGDVCHAVAMLQAIQRRYPDLMITWVIGKVEYQLLKYLPNVEFVIFDKSQGWRSYFQLRAQLRKRKFDVLLHMQVALRATLASFAISAKLRVGFDSQRAKEGQWLVTNHRIEAQKEPHVLDGFMGFATAVGVTNIQPTWNIPISEDDALFAKKLIGQDKIFIICPSASKAERNWLAARYAAIAEHAVNKGFRVFICGGPAPLEKALAHEIEQLSHVEIENYVGKTSLTQLLGLLKWAKLVLAPDTGPAHMAVTQQTPVIGLYAHSNPNRTGPYLYLDHVINAYEKAINVQQLGPVAWGARAKGEHLMEMITVAEVIQYMDALIYDLAL